SPLAVAIVAAALLVSCGKSGPPLPPLVRVPAAPGDLIAERRGDAVDLHFTVPTTNTDGTRPANEDHVDVYAMTTAEPLTDDEIVAHGTRVARVDVKAPRDPDRTVDSDESDADVEPPAGLGLDQGAIVRVTESLTGQTLTAPALPRDDKRHVKRGRDDARQRPLLGPAT